MTGAPFRLSVAIATSTALISSPAFAQSAKIDAADTAWMIGATSLVLMMTIPGLALFYAGMVRKKNVLATMAQCMAATFLVSILWAIVGYSLTFTGNGVYIGTLERMFLYGMTLDSISPLAKTIPESLFMVYQMTFAVITVALVAGSVADRLRFSAFLLFCAFWLLLVYVPIAHWVWGGGFLGIYGVIDFAGGLVVHLNAGIAGLVAAYVVGKRRGYGTENLAPYDLTLAVIGTGLLWVGWFGFNGGSALGANARAAMAITSTHLAASAGAFTWMALEWSTRGKPSVLGMISGGCGGSRHHHARFWVRTANARHADRCDRRRHLLLGLHLAQTQTGLRRLARRVRRTWSRRPYRNFPRRRACGRRFVGHSRNAPRRVGIAGRQSSSGIGSALRNRRDLAVVGYAHLRRAKDH